MGQVKDLKANPQNPRKISDKKLEMLAKSLKEFGDLSGVVFNKRTGQLVGGHQRIKVIDPKSEIKITKSFEKPTETGTTAQGYIVVMGERYAYREVDWDETKEKAANIAANKHGGEFDLPQLSEWLLDLDAQNFDLELTGFEESELENLMAPVASVEGLCDADEVPEHVEPKTRPGDIYQLGRHRLMCGDSTSIDAVEKLMAGEKADMVFTDPPYNIASDSKNYAKDTSKAMHDLANAEWDKGFEVEPALSTAMAVCADSVTVYVWTSHFLIQKIWDHLNTWCDFTNYCVWAKPNPMPSLSKRHWTWSTELCVYGTRGSKRKVNFPREGHASNVWTFTKKSDGSHLTQKPVELCQHPIEFSSDPGQSVLDLFGGSGSTLIACEKTNRKCFMMELDPRYCDVIVARWEKYTGKKAELVNGS